MELALQANGENFFLVACFKFNNNKLQYETKRVFLKTVFFKLAVLITSTILIRMTSNFNSYFLIAFRKKLRRAFFIKKKLYFISSFYEIFH